MEGSVGAPPQRVCPKCARISWATGSRCPYCRARFRRQALPAFAWMLAGAVVITLAGVAALLIVVGTHVENQVDDRVETIQREFDDIRTEIDQRLPAGGIPSVTPVPSVAPTAVPSETPSATETVSPTETATATASPTATSTPAASAETPAPAATVIGP